MKNTGYLLLLMALCFITACKSDPPAVNKTALLTASGWKTIAIRSSLDNGDWTDQFTLLPDCTKDDMTYFTASGTFRTEQGATKCNPADPQIINSGTWAFRNNETQIATVLTGQSQTISTVLQLDGGSLKIKKQSDNGGHLYTLEQTMVHP